MVFFCHSFSSALLRGNSCARRLRVVCFSVSSQRPLANETYDFLCPSRNAAPRLGSRPLSLSSAPITRAEMETQKCTYMLCGIALGCGPLADVPVLRALGCFHGHSRNQGLRRR